MIRCVVSRCDSWTYSSRFVEPQNQFEYSSYFNFYFISFHSLFFSIHIFLTKSRFQWLHTKSISLLYNSTRTRHPTWTGLRTEKFVFVWTATTAYKMHWLADTLCVWALNKHVAGVKKKINCSFAWHKCTVCTQSSTGQIMRIEINGRRE